MHFLGYYAGISKQSESLLWTLAGICCTIFDTSLFHLKEDLFKVWTLRLDPILFSENAQVFMKYLITSIVLVRTLSIHIYLAMYIVMLWPIVFEDRPGLILPWLAVGALRNVITVALSLVTGSYICLKYFFTKLICFEFLLAQLIEHGPSIYIWLCVLSYYKELRAQCNKVSSINDFEELVRRRRKTRSLMRKLCFYDPNADRQLVSISTIENVVNQLNSTLHRPNTRSLDSLLTNLAAVADQEEILNMEQIKSIEDENDLSIQEKTKRLLNISESEIRAAKQCKNDRSLILISDIKILSKPKEVPMKPFINVYSPRSEHSAHLRVQSDPTVWRRAAGRGERSRIGSETEIQTIPMSSEDENSISFTCTRFFCKNSDSVDNKQSHGHGPNEKTWVLCETKVEEFYKPPTVVVYALTNTNTKHLNEDPPEPASMSTPTTTAEAPIILPMNSSSYTSLEFTYDSTTTSNSDLNVPSCCSKVNENHSSLIQLTASKNEETESVNIVVDEQFSTFKPQTQPEKAVEIFDPKLSTNESAQTNSSNEFSLSDGVVAQKMKTRPRAKQTPRIKLPEVGQRPPPRKTIRYSKDEKFHQDGFTLEYMKKLTNAKSVSASATTSLKNNDKDALKR